MEQVKKVYRLPLSPREAEVMVALWDGLGVKGAAARLGLSDKTAKNYTFALFRKLNVTTQIQMVRKALELGLLQVPERARPPRVEVPG